MSAVLLTFAVTGPSMAQDPREGPPSPVTFAWQDQWWEGKVITEIRATGLVTQTLDGLRETVLRLREGTRLTQQGLNDDIHNLMRTGYFDHSTLAIVPLRDPANADGVILEIRVRELELVSEIVLQGPDQIDESELRTGLGIIRNGDRLNPHLLWQDRRHLQETYRNRGYHFAEVQSRTEPAGEGRARLIWEITEGPEVNVDEIIFHGNEGVSEDELEGIMGTRESSFLSSAQYVQTRLELDIMRLRLMYAQKGYLDMTRGETIFVENLEFSADRTSVTIHIRIIETPLYRIGEITIDGEGVVDEALILEKIRPHVGDACDETLILDDLEEVRNLYAERSYILANVDHAWEALPPTQGEHAMRLRLTIAEREPATVGIIQFEGHRLTRDDVLRRELREFAPGEPFDGVALERGIQRLYDTGWFEPGTITHWHQPGVIPGTLDVNIKVEERRTGTFRLLGGYSSAFGIVGVIEFTQQNFDIARLPRSLDEFIRGESFVGGGQYFNIRYMPGQRRQQFSISFREPYIFGLDYGGGFRFYRTLTERESWDEDLLGGSLFLDRRWGDLRVAMNLSASQIDISSVESDAPRAIRALRGVHNTVEIGPSVRYDHRDSTQFPSSGYLAELDTGLANEAYGSDFNFWKMQLHGQYLIPVIEPEDRNRMRRHVLTLESTLGIGDGYSGDDSIPIWDRYFAGGRGSMRGFEFRGMGPHEGDDPTGGQMLVLGTVEYSFPIYQDFLRLAVFYDVGNLAPEVSELGDDRWRHTLGFGVRALIPFLSSAPVALDFGFALNEDDQDDTQLITFDIGKLF